MVKGLPWASDPGWRPRPLGYYHDIRTPEHSQVNRSSFDQIDSGKSEEGKE